MSKDPIIFVYVHPKHLKLLRSGKIKISITKPVLATNSTVNAYTKGESQGWFEGVDALMAEVERLCNRELRQARFRKDLYRLIEKKLFGRRPGKKESSPEEIFHRVRGKHGIKIPLVIFMWKDVSGTEALVFGHLCGLTPMAKNPSTDEALPWSTSVIAKTLGLKPVIVNRAIVGLCQKNLVIDEGSTRHPKLMVNPNWEWLAFKKRAGLEAWLYNDERTGSQKGLTKSQKVLTKSQKVLTNLAQTLDGRRVSVSYSLDPLDGRDTHPSLPGNFHDQEGLPANEKGTPDHGKGRSAHWDPRKLKTLLLMHPALPEKFGWMKEHQPDQFTCLEDALRRLAEKLGSVVDAQPWDNSRGGDHPIQHMHLAAGFFSASVDAFFKRMQDAEWQNQKVPRSLMDWSPFIKGEVDRFERFMRKRCRNDPKDYRFKNHEATLKQFFS